MVKKKDEKNVVEEVKEVAEKVLEKTEDVVEEVEKVAKKIVKKVKEAVGDKKSTSKKSEKKEKKVESKKLSLEELKKKAASLEKKFEKVDKVDIKEAVSGDKEEEEKKDILVPIEDYLKSSIHLGTRVITPHMRQYVYRRRADGLAVFNTAMLDDLIKEGADYLSKFAPEDIVITCKREAGWKAVKLFADTFGIKVFTKKYPAGTLTNTNLEDFFEKDLVFICDPWVDKNALKDANSVKIKVMSICDTNNLTFGINKIIPGNNKSAKSLGMIFYLLTKLYAEKRKIKVEIPSIQEFVDDWDNLVPPK
jgi:small subunit ribosomal protein S2